MTEKVWAGTLVRASLVVLDAYSGEILTDAGIYIEGDEILRVGPWNQISAGQSAREIDLGDLVLFPGLMESHAHLAFDASHDPVASLLKRDEDENLAVMRRSASDLAASGVTYARDLGSPGALGVSVREEIREGKTQGPFLHVAGNPITSRNGHCWFMSREVSTGYEAQSAVSQLAASGVDLVKIMVTGGRMTEGTDPLSVELDPKIIDAVVNEAHQLGLPVTAHCLAAVGVAAAVGAGVDVIEHGTFLGPGNSDAFSREVVDEMAERQIALSPTLRWPWHHDIDLEKRGRWVLQAHDAGVQILLGTDSGIAGHFHAGGVHAGMLGFRECGLSIRDVLGGATERGMRAVGVTGRGAIRSGYKADLLGMAKNPLDTLEAFAALRFIMLGGVPVQASGEGTI